MEDKNDLVKGEDQGEKRRSGIDLNLIFPDKGYDLNRLFPDEETKKLLYDLRRNKREIDRFIKSLQIEEE